MYNERVRFLKCPQEMTQYIQEYLDGELSVKREQKLKEHLQVCPDCKQYLHEMKKTVALIQSTSHIQVPSGFTAKVMESLPKEKKRVGFQRWVRRYPFLTAAALFLLLMGGSVFSLWNEEQQFSVSKQPNLIVENDVVIVPEGEIIEGDVVVRNGKLKIEGSVHGNVTIINGEVIDGDKYLASAGQVSGEIKEVNQVFDWLWYHVKKTAKELLNVFGDDNEKGSLVE